MKGIYILLLRIKKDLNMRIGSLGIIHFSSGMYAYIGSAQNSLEKRIERHIKRNKKKYWHIDYLTTHKHVRVERIFYKPLGKEWEDRVALMINKHGRPIKGFGASDSKIDSHLFFIHDFEGFYALLNNLGFSIVNRKI